VRGYLKILENTINPLNETDSVSVKIKPMTKEERSRLRVTYDSLYDL